jgi:ATP-binding cassette subfamily F protein 3
LHEGQSPIDHMKMIAPTGSVQEFRDYLGRWSFPGNRAFELVGDDAGGQ